MVSYSFLQKRVKHYTLLSLFLFPKVRKTYASHKTKTFKHFSPSSLRAWSFFFIFILQLCVHKHDTRVKFNWKFHLLNNKNQEFSGRFSSSVSSHLLPTGFNSIRSGRESLNFRQVFDLLISGEQTRTEVLLSKLLIS